MISKGKRNEIISNVIQWNGKVTLKGIKAKCGIRRDASIDEVLDDHIHELKYASTKDANEQLKVIREAVFNFKQFNKKENEISN